MINLISICDHPAIKEINYRTVIHHMPSLSIKNALNRMYVYKYAISTGLRKNLVVGTCYAVKYDETWL